MKPAVPLSQADRLEVFKSATSGLMRHCGGKQQTGMTDAELGAALEMTLGVFGGSGGPDKLSVTFQGAGLKIWGGWHVVNHVKEKPLFAGRQTVAMAREVYNIPNPDNDQLSLF